MTRSEGFIIPGWADPQGILRNDSVRLVKWNPRSAKEETIAVILGDRMRSDIRQRAKVPRIPTVGYAAQDAWVVGENGVVRIVRAGSYRIESHGPSTAAVVGPSYGYATRAVSARDKEAYVREFLATSPMSGKGPGGGLGFSPQPSETEVTALVKGTEYAERHPMFSAGDVIAAAVGRLWVGRPPAEGQPRQYDVFDEAGRRVSVVELPSGRRVMAVGRMGVYVVAESETGIQRLERYPVP